MALLLSSFTLIHPEHPQHHQETDLLIEQGKITAIVPGGEIQEGNYRVIKGNGNYVSAGWVDMQANFCDPGEEYKETLLTGSRAAAAGGFTGVLLHPNTIPVVQQKSTVNHISTFSGGVPRLFPAAAVTLETAGTELTEMIDLHRAGAVAFTDGYHSLWHPQVMLKALQYTGSFGGLLINRAEDRHLAALGHMHEGNVSIQLGMSGIPVIAETASIQRDLLLLQYALEEAHANPPHLHFSNISSAEGLALIADAKVRKLPVSCDVSISHLLYTDEDVSSFDTNFKLVPPLRGQTDREALLKGVADGTVDVIVSAHRPQDIDSKNCEFDLASSGSITLQSFFPMLNKLAGNDLPLSRLIQKITSAPRELLGLEQPAFEEGASANLTWFSADEEWMYDRNSNYSVSTNTPLMNELLHGKVKGVINAEKMWIDE